MIRRTWDLRLAGDRMQAEAIRRRRPLNCVLELTYRCNFHCRMCYVRMSGAQAAPFGRLRTLDEWLDMARQLRDAGVLYLSLTGGECTGYPGFVPLYEELCRMGFLVTVMTNAAALSEPVRDVFRRYPPRSAAVTLYGGSNETYARVTGDPEGLDRALSGIRYFRSLGIPVSLNFTAVRQNILDYPLVGRICADLGLPYTMITDITPHRHDPSFSEAPECRLSPAQRAAVDCHTAQQVAEAMEAARDLEKELSGFCMPAPPPEPLPPEPDACIGSSCGCAIYWNGDMQSCVSMYGYRCVKPFEIGFEAAWEQLKAQQDTTFRRPAACLACSMAPDCLHTCAARRFEGSGSPHEPDPYQCMYTWLLRKYRSKTAAAESPPAPACV